MLQNEQFVYNKDVSFYITQGWTIVSPTKMTCPRCDSALIQNPKFDFLFCVPCQAKIIVNNGDEQPLNSHQQVVQQPIQSQYHSPNNTLTENDLQQSKTIKNNNKAPQLLLQGWKMTSYVCPTPNCHFPLMQEPKGAKLVCENCGLETELKEGIKKISTSIDPGLLAKQIAQRVNDKLNKGPETQIESQELQYQSKGEEYSTVQEQNNALNEEQQQQLNRFREQLEALDQKIYDSVDQVLEPNTNEEIQALKVKITLLKETRELLRSIIDDYARSQ